MESTSNLVLLTATNWEVWKVEMKVLLMHYGAWEFIENPEIADKPGFSDGEGETEELTYKEKLI